VYLRDTATPITLNEDGSLMSDKEYLNYDLMVGRCLAPKRNSLTPYLSSKAKEPTRIAEDRRARIKSEKKLVESFISLFAPRVDHMVATEFDCSNGIADLVIVELGEWSPNGKQISQVNSRWLYALAMLPYRRAFHIDSFTASAGTTHRRAVEAMQEFCEAGFCRASRGQNMWLKAYQPRKVLKRTCAIEAKLSDWRRALSQANRYKDFANEVWVLMDSASVSAAASNIEEFKRQNIGLVAISSSKEVDFLFVPAFDNPRSDSREWQANGLMAALIT